MRKLQEEHREWVTRKYPNQGPKIPAVGCLEEAGELVHAILKMEQVKTWGEDSRHSVADLRLKLVDAIGDCGIYACSLCNANEWDFAIAWEEEPYYAPNDAEALDSAIVLVQAATEVALEPSDDELLHRYIGQLKTVAKCLGLDADAAVQTTWLTVKER